MEETVPEFRSKYAIRVYVGIVIATGVFLLVNFFALQSLGLIDTASHDSGVTPIGIFGVALFDFSVLAFFRGLYRHVPVIKCDSNAVALKWPFSERVHNWSDVRSVDLIARDRVAIIFLPQTCEVTKLLFDDMEFPILVDWYRNSDELRRYLSTAKTVKLPHSTPKPHIAKAETEQQPGNAFELLTESGDSNVQRFAGTFIFSIIGFGWIGLTYLSLVYTANTPNGIAWSMNDILLRIAMFGLFTVVFGSKAYYFEIQGPKLVVRNHLLIWKRLEYPFVDISDAYIHTVYRSGSALRITTRNFESKDYIGSSLSSKKWQALETALKGNGFRVSEGTW